MFKRWVKNTEAKRRKSRERGKIFYEVKKLLNKAYIEDGKKYANSCYDDSEYLEGRVDGLKKAIGIVVDLQNSWKED